MPSHATPPVPGAPPGPAPGVLDDVLQLALALTGAPGAVLTLLDGAHSVVAGDRDVLASVHRLDVDVRDAEGRLVGVLSAMDRGPWEWSDRARAALVRLARIAAAEVGYLRTWDERERIARALRERDEQFRVLAASSPTAIFRSDLEGRVTYVNARGIQVWEAPESELLGHGWIARLHPEDRDAMVAGWTQAMAAGVELYRYDYRLLMPDGRVRHVAGQSAMLRDDAGEVVGTVGTVEDVTEQRRTQAALRESEARFRALIEKASEVVALLDADGMVRYVAGAVQRTLGHEPDALVGTPVFARIHPDDEPAVREALAALLADPGRVIQAQYRHAAADGGYRTLSVVATNQLHDPDVRGLVVNAQDVTEQERLAEQLRQAQKMEAVGRLAGGIAHDFNNLVQVITASTTFVREELPAASGVHEDLVEVEAAANRAAALTRQLLAFSRQQVLRPQRVELSRVAADMERMLRRVIGETISLVAVLHGDVPPVYADPGQLEQVLLNLALNARDAMPAGGTLTIEARAVTLDARAAARRPGLAPGTYPALVVRDTGLGMDAATQARIFEPFFTTKPQGQGTGLGLATVLGIVEQSGGRVLVESAPGAGSTFTVLLPPDTSSEAPAPVAEPVVAGPPRPATVLVVEDEGTVREMVRRMLDRAGYTVLEASDGDEAMRVLAARAGEVQLVLTDAVMPGMSARDLIPALAERHPRLPVLVMTGYSADVIATQGALVPNGALLHKPFTVADLLARVRALLDESPASRAAA